MNKSKSQPTEMKTWSVLTFQGTSLLAKSCSMFPATPNTMAVLWWNPEPTMENKTFSNSAVWCNTIKYGWAWTRSSRVHDRTNRRVSSDVSCKYTGIYSAYTDVTCRQWITVTSIASDYQPGVRIPPRVWTRTFRGYLLTYLLHGA